jgi:Spy/CpxP family protein refolding chaperone
MKVEFATDEAWELMSHVIGRMLEEADLTDADRAKVRRWKSDEMRATSQEMRVLTSKINDDLEKMLARKIKSQIRKPDWR